MAATSPLPPPLARKREFGVFLDSFPSRWPPPHYHHPLLLANASWGCSLIRFPCDGRHLTTTTPSRSQTRVGGVSQFVSLATAATSPPPPLSLTNASWGCFSIHFLRDGRHVPTTTPSRLQMRVGGVSHARQPYPPPSPQERDGGGLVSISTAPPTPPSPQERDGGRSCFYFCGTTPLPRPNSETEGVHLLCYSTTAPSLALSEQRGSICLVVIRYIIVYIVVIRYIIGYIY